MNDNKTADIVESAIDKAFLVGQKMVCDVVIKCINEKATIDELLFVIKTMRRKLNV